MLSGCYQLMWAHSHLMWFLALGYYQLMWSRKTDVIGSCDLYYRAATLNFVFCNKKADIYYFGGSQLEWAITL